MVELGHTDELGAVGETAIVLLRSVLLREASAEQPAVSKLAKSTSRR